MHNRQPVADELARALPNTLSLSIVTLLFSFLVSILLGVCSAMTQGSIFDRIVMMLANFLASMPGYFASLLLLYVFSLKLNLFPVLLDDAAWPSIILPTLALSVGLIAPYTRQIRAVISQESKKLYVLGASSRGVSKIRIYVIHILRNCITTLLTMAGNPAWRLNYCGKNFWLAWFGKFGDGCDYPPRLHNATGIYCCSGNCLFCHQLCC